MKFMTDRKEIAQAININRTPVIRIDISEPMKGWDDCYEGDKVVIESEKYDGIRCKVKMFGDEENANYHKTPWLYQRIVLMPETVGLTNSFGYTDVKEMYEWNKATRIEAGQDVIVMFDAGKTAFLREMKLEGNSMSPFVYPVAKLVDR